MEVAHRADHHHAAILPVGADNPKVANGWLPADRLIHYGVHETLDVKHADDFFEVLQASWHDTRQARYYIEQGLLMGAFLFDSLYCGLWRARARRYLRDVTGPHSRA